MDQNNEHFNKPIDISELLAALQSCKSKSPGPESTKLLTKEQCGFRRNHSTLDALTSLHTDICSAFRRNHHLITIALDITNAYDTVWKKRVLTILHLRKINGNLLKFIKNFLADRTFSVKVNDKTSSTHTIENELPQGSILSVTLFLVAINNICNNLPKPAKFILFADDCIIYCSRSQIITTTLFLQQALDSLARWSSETGLSFSSTKTQCIVFIKKKKDPLPILNLMNTQFPFANSIRIVGLIFDHKLTWRPHLKIKNGMPIKN
ncbi:PREDICTED: RNA-directed DNA polymerase from mobile element jockey-like [Diuraphis noxia]|uniref:RNA-directed DNA polymerase from mobile element jockey-like n=1 Tax=Diuraphis noxia TaxID=143948 RepID=UPI0007637100|nr:PREDICTED: RNA-directed DNA polymerase from mobile element jockey-like [Diuraphis noxia]